MTNSKIMQTVEHFLPKAEREEIKELDTYQTMQRDFEYLEDFVGHEGVPNIAELVSQLISSQVRQSSNPELRPSKSRSYEYSTQGTDNNLTIDYGLFGIGVKSKAYGANHSGPTIQIHRFGHNRPGGLKNSKKGVHLQCYDIPTALADIVLGEFTKLEGERNNIILELARLQELKECSSEGHWTSFEKKYIDKGDIPSPGIDETSCFVLEKDLKTVLVYGSANGFKSDETSISLDIRVEVAGKRFQFPSERQPGFDITEAPYQGKPRKGCLHYLGDEMPKETSNGNSFISVNLVGKNPDYKEHKTPENPARPAATEVTYTDDYLRQLNEQYPIIKVLGKKTVKQLAEGKEVSGFVMDSPMKNAESEHVMGSMLHRSAQAGKWQPIVLDVQRDTGTHFETAGAYLDTFESSNSTYGNNARAGFALPIAIDSAKVMIVPSQTFVEYIMNKK